MANTRNILITLVLLVIGFALSPVVGTFAAQAAGNASGSAATIYNLGSLFWALLCLGIATGALYKQFQ